MKSLEIIKTTEPPSNIICKDCKYRLLPVTIQGVIVERHTYGTCAAFPNKPSDILWNNGICELYEKD